MSSGISRGKYKGRKADRKTHELIIKLIPNYPLTETTRLPGCSESQVKLIWPAHQKS